MSVKELFNEASELSADERTRFLDARCGADAQLRTAVESLLQAHDSAGDFFAEPTNAHARVPDPNPPPKQIGSYKILQTIGEGGFGTVYLAEQQQPVRRRVALKLIKLGMDTKQVIARFEAERQALAMMDHPNIARVFDGGATDNGRPYFVMELVNGVPITQYCDDSKLTARQRLELFIPVCQAVQHAHQKGIIHRDLKPSNVLITLHDGRPVAKVIDFGVAKATQSRLTEKTLFTEFRSMIGTPEYMSPEQAEMSGLDVDTRSDVYSLGVLMYELLTGSTPFDARELRSKAYGEMQRVIREVDPPKPSTRISSSRTLASVAAQRSTEPRKLSSTVRGELDWIVMRCIEKDRTRRYDSAAALADDVSRYLSDEPVRAVAPSRIYRTRKYVKRHRVGVAASAAVVLALVGGIVGTTVGLVRASQREREAKTQAAIADAVSRFQTDMLGSADPEKLLGDKVTVVDAMTAAVKELDAGALRDQQLVEAAVRDMIGTTLHNLGRFDAAEGNIRRAIELRRAVSGASSVGTQGSMVSLGGILYSKGQPSESERELREALKIARAAGPSFPRLQLAKTLDNLGITLRAQGRFVEAEQLLRESNDIYQHDPAADDRQRAAGIGNVAQALFDQNKLDDAEPLYRACLALQRQTLPPNHPQTLSTLTNLSWLYFQQRRLPEATKLAREALDGTRKSYPVDHPAIASSLLSLGTILFQDDHDEEAEKCLREGLAIQRRALAANHPDIAATLNNLAAVLLYRHDYVGAEAAYRESLQIARGALPADHPDLSMAKCNLAMSLNDQQKFADAEPLLRDAIEVETKVRQRSTSTVAGALLLLGESQLGQKRYGDAETTLIEAGQRLSESKSPSWRVEKCQKLLTEARQHLPPSPATSPSSPSQPTSR